MSFSNWSSTNQDLARQRNVEQALLDLDERLHRIADSKEVPPDLYRALVDIYAVLKERM